MCSQECTVEIEIGVQVLVGGAQVYQRTSRPDVKQMSAQRVVPDMGLTLAKSKPYVFSLLDLNGPNAGEYGDVSELVYGDQKKIRTTPARVFEEQLPFSWAHFCFGLFSLVLMCSDVPRSGLGISKFPSEFHVLGPDILVSFDPWHYPVKMLFTHNASETSLRAWAYKYDTTSIGLQAFAEYYRLPIFSQCVLYDGSCANSSVS